MSTEILYLQNRIRQLGDDMNEKCKRHMLEIEKTRDFYQEQITDLLEERDELEKEKEIQNTTVIELKEQIERQDKLIAEIQNELESKNKLISTLQQNIKSLGDESVSVFNFLEQKYSAEIQELKDKLNTK